jgi:quercetin dioxygenase-like cupin family protein
MAYAPARSDADRHLGGWGAQHWGGPIEEIRSGDVIWFPPGEKHWHGATPTTAMTHIAIQEALKEETESGQTQAVEVERRQTDA